MSIYGGADAPGERRVREQADVVVARRAALGEAVLVVGAHEERVAVLQRDHLSWNGMERNGMDCDVM